MNAQTSQRISGAALAVTLLLTLTTPATAEIGRLDEIGAMGGVLNLGALVKQALRGEAPEGVIVEINASPHRLDLDWRWGERIAELGLVVGIHPDAHSVRGLDDVQYGVGTARKAALTPEQVTNTWPIELYLERLRSRREKAGIA